MSQFKNSIFKEIKNEFGQRTLKIAREYEKKAMKLATYRNHLTFAVKCKVNEVIPKGLRLKCGMKNKKTKEIIQRAERQILREHTRQTKATKDAIQRDVNKLKEDLETSISGESFEKLEGLVRSKENKVFEDVKARQIAKYEKLSKTNGAVEDDVMATETERAQDGIAETAHAGNSAHEEGDRLGRPGPGSAGGVDNGDAEDTGEGEERSTAEATDIQENITDKWIVNVAGIVLTEHETSVLRKGLNFVPTPKSIPTAEFITAVEDVCRSSDIPEEVANRLRFDVTKVLRTAKPPPGTNLSKEEWKALRDLQERQDIVILPADKGRAVCILTQDQYKEKVETLLGDRETYDEMERDPTPKFTRETRGILKAIERKGNLDRRTYLALYPSDPLPPLFYGLPKVHKSHIPLRPIVSSIGSVTYDISKHIASLLSKLVGKSEYHVRDTNSFVRGLQDIRIEEGEVMVSFDVEALFTSVPVQVACEEARLRLEKEFSDEESTLRAKTTLDVPDIVQLLRLCLETAYFRVDGKFYRQKWGTAMGSPVSVVVANLFMESLEQSALQSFPHPIKYWRRYVDDTFVVVKSELVSELLNHLNSQHDRIRFTYEVEKEGSLPFLDVRVLRRQDGHLETQIYRKQTHTDKYLDFASHHSTQQKASVPRTLFTRSARCSTTEEARREEDRHVRQALRKNGYPNNFIQRSRKQLRAKERLNAIRQTPGDQNRGDGGVNGGDQAKRPTVCIPYIQGVSEQITRLLKPHAKVSTKPGINLRDRLVRAKDRLGTKSKGGLVYEYRCQCGMVYVGETGRTLRTREMDHKRAIRNGNGDHSGISKHVLDTGHQIMWDEVRIVCHERNWHKRKMKEGYFISKLPGDKCMNILPGWQVPEVYKVL